MQLDWGFIILVAIVVIGFLEWLKKLLESLPPKPGVVTLPAWVWSILMFASSVLFSMVFQITPTWVRVGCLAFAIAQLGYSNLIKLIQRKIDAMDSSSAPKVEFPAKDTP